LLTHAATPGTSHRNQILVATTRFFMKMGISDKQALGLVAEASPLVCADLKAYFSGRHLLV